MLDATGRDVLVVIVGAGASLDCAAVTLPGPGTAINPIDGSTLPARPYREVLPPLTKDLATTRGFFNEVLERYPAATNVVSFLRDELGEAADDNAETLERALERYQARQSLNLEVPRQLMAFRFYLRDLLLGCTDYMLSPDIGGFATNYTTLVRECHQWACRRQGHVCFVSFNYDVLLEDACEHTWADFDSRVLDTYCADRFASVVKPHGSALWERQFEVYDQGAFSVQQRANRVIRRGSEIGAVANIRGLQARPDRRDTSQTYEAVPHLALPLRDKTELLWPLDQAHHFETLHGRVHSVLTVGWRGAEEHFVDVLRRATHGALRVAACTGGVDEAANAVEAGAIGDRFGDGSQRPPTRTFPRGFTNLVRSGDLQRFLADG